MRDITVLMTAYRECARNLWNVYFSRKENVGGALDDFDEIDRRLFEALVVNELDYEEDLGEPPRPLLRVVPRCRTEILIEQPHGPGEATPWGERSRRFVVPDEISLEFLGYFDFEQIPIKEYRYLECKILRMSGQVAWEGRRALLVALDCLVFHDLEDEMARQLEQRAIS